MTTRVADGEPRLRVFGVAPEEILSRLSAEELRDHFRVLRSVTEAVLSRAAPGELLPRLHRLLEGAFSVEAAAVLLGTADQIGQGIAGTVAARRQAAIVDDVAAFGTTDPRARDLSCMMVAPLIVGEELLGVLYVGTREARTFRGRDLYLLEVVAGQIELAAWNALADERLAATAQRAAEAEAAFLESVGRSRTLAEVDPNGILVMDDRSVILAANPAVERIFGYAAGELVGQPMSVLIPERFRDAHHAGVRRYLASGERNIPWTGAKLTGLTKSGREIPVEIGFGDYVEDGKHVFAGFVQDLSERKRVEARRAAEHGVARVMASNASPEKVGPAALAAICEGLGWEFGAFWTPDAALQRLQCDAVWHSGGTLAACFAEATHVTTFACGEGLPGRVWRDARAHWIVDVLHDGNFPRVEAAAEAGLHAAFAVPILMDGEVEGVMDFFARESEEPDEALLDTMEAIGYDIGQYLRRRRAEGERDRALAAALEARTLAEEANRAKAGFLATMSHELRTPLNAIVGYADLIQAGIPEQAPQGTLKQAERIDVASRHLLSLIDDLLGFASLEAGHETLHVVPFDVCEVMDEVHAIMEPMARAKQIELRVTTPDGPIQMKSDPQRLRQILINLVGNSVKFTDRGEVDLVAWERGGDIHFRVRDTGRGIAKAHLAKMFEPFWQADQSSTRTVSGTGLGLAVTQRLVRALGSEMSVESDLGHGTTFSLRIPVEPPAHAPHLE